MSDLIERDKAMKVAMWFGRSEQKYSHSFIKKRVMEIPSARPQGEWVHLKGDEWLCSNCGYVIWTDEELERIIHDAKEKARKEIARTKGVTDGNK